MPDMPCTICVQWKLSLLKSTSTLEPMSTRCIIPQVCSVAYGLIWPLKQHSWDVVMDTNVIVGITLKSESLKTWAYSLHTCNRLINGLNEIRDEEGLPAQTYHKEEIPSRIKADTKDRETLREKLKLIIDPLDPEQHQEGLVNVITGKVVCHSSVNVNNVIMVRKKQMETFDQTFPEGFHDIIPRKVITMLVGPKSMKMGDA